MKFLKWENIKPILSYNKCYICKTRRNLNECNSCLELYCIKCDTLSYTCCGYCKNNIKSIKTENLLYFK